MDSGNFLILPLYISLIKWLHCQMHLAQDRSEGKLTYWRFSLLQPPSLLSRCPRVWHHLEWLHKTPTVNHRLTYYTHVLHRYFIYTTRLSIVVEGKPNSVRCKPITICKFRQTFQHKTGGRQHEVDCSSQLWWEAPGTLCFSSLLTHCGQPPK